jgi:hypothetical protein
VLLIWYVAYLDILEEKVIINNENKINNIYFFKKKLSTMTLVVKKINKTNDGKI